MIHQPRFKRCYHIEIVESEGIFLLSEVSSFLLGSRLVQLIAPLINGDRTVDEIIDLLQGKASAAEVYYALMLMEQKGYIVEANENLLPAVAAFCDGLNITSQEANRRLQTTTVTVQSFGAVAIEPLLSTLKSLNIQVCQEESERVREGQFSPHPTSDRSLLPFNQGGIPNSKLVVVLTDDYLQDGLDAFNQTALQSKQPWLLVKPVGTTVWIGPIFHPGKTGCWECLAQRLRGNRPVETFIQKRKGTSTPFLTSSCELPATQQTALNLTANEIIKWIVQQENQQLEGKLVTLDTLTLETQNHILVQRPQCPICGFPESIVDTDAVPLVLQNRKKKFTTDGGHRCFLPEETLKKYECHISPITGVVRGLRQISLGENRWMHTYMARHHFSTMFDDLDALRQNIQGRSAGKGRTNIQAKVSAACEAIERYSGVFQGDEIRQKGSYQLLKDKAIHPNTCMNFSQEQYINRARWNASCPSWFQKVPEPFDEERLIDWTPIWSLTHQVFKYLPTAYCYYGYPKPEKADCWADSNGCAAGNTLEEAILQGFMELVERDSVALWWYNWIKRPGVNLESFDEPYFQSLKDYYQSISRELWVLDITSDLNIPAFAAISRRTDRDREDIIFGYGAHFDSKIAIQRALTELNQSLPAVLSVAEEDGSTQYSSSQQLEIEWWKTATIENQPYLIPDTMVAPKGYADYPQHGSDDLLDDVVNCVAIAKQQGMEVLVLNQTRPDIGLNVVKVVVPGMRHFWRRLGPGRLYNVPVKLGWLNEPRQENQLNPFPIDS